MEQVAAKRTILLVEDEELLRQVVAEKLGDVGYRVLTASNGTEALEIAAKFSGEIDLLITDILMPQLSGTKLAQSMRSARPNLKVLFVSGDSNEKSPPLGGMSRLDKPFSLKLLAAKVSELLQS